MRRLSRVGRLALGSAIVLGLGSGACEDQSYRRIGGEINVLVRRSRDAQAEPARARLVGYGRRAIPQIETALHTAPERGRLHLIAALEAIGDGEAAPILRHCAVYDTSDEVRAACDSTLAGWAAAGGTRGEQARAAIARIGQLRTSGEGPTPPRR